MWAGGSVLQLTFLLDPALGCRLHGRRVLGTSLAKRPLSTPWSECWQLARTAFLQGRNFAGCVTNHAARCDHEGMSATMATLTCGCSLHPSWVFIAFLPALLALQLTQPLMRSEGETTCTISASATAPADSVLQQRTGLCPSAAATAVQPSQSGPTCRLSPLTTLVQTLAMTVSDLQACACAGHGLCMCVPVSQPPWSVLGLG